MEMNTSCFAYVSLDRLIPKIWSYTILHDGCSPDMDTLILIYNVHIQWLYIQLFTAKGVVVH